MQLAASNSLRPFQNRICKKNPLVVYVVSISQCPETGQCDSKSDVVCVVG